MLTFANGLFVCMIGCTDVKPTCLTSDTYLPVYPLLYLYVPLQRLLTIPGLRGSELLYGFFTSDIEFSSSFLPDLNLGGLVCQCLLLWACGWPIDVVTYAAQQYYSASDAGVSSLCGKYIGLVAVVEHFGSGS